MLDSGATNHMLGDTSEFVNFTPEYGVVKLGGKNKAIVSLGRGDTRYFKDALFVPALRDNLISVSKLDKEGFESRFGNGAVQIFRASDSQLYMAGQAYNNLYYLDSANVNRNLAPTCIKMLPTMLERIFQSVHPTSTDADSDPVLQIIDEANVTKEPETTEPDAKEPPKDIDVRGDQGFIEPATGLHPSMRNKDHQKPEIRGGNPSISQPQQIKASVLETLKYTHTRWGHPSTRVLLRAVKDGMVIGNYSQLNLFAYEIITHINVFGFASVALVCNQ